MKKVLVLCGSNSCRSQMAEGYLQFYAKQWIEVFSAGVREADVHPLTIEVMAEDSIDITHHLSKAYDRFQGQHFDYLITLCDEAKENLPGFIHFDHHLHFDIPDPVEAEGNKEDQLIIFRDVREIVKKRMLRFIGQKLIEAPVAAVQ